MVAAVTVNGGTFDGKSYSVWLGSDYNDPVNSTLRINGGNFLNDINIQDVAREDAITVTGGIFSLDVSDYCIEGCNCVYSGSNYVVSHDIEPDSSGNVSLKATDSNTAFITTSYDVQTVDVQLARGSVSFESGTYGSTMQVSIIPTHNTQESPELIATYELNIEGVSGFWVLVTFDAVITDGLVPMVYSTVNGVQVTEDVVSFTDSSVTIRTNHNTPFWILAVEPDEPSLNPGTDYDDDESLPPFIPQQPAGDDNTTLYIACCAAAAVVALLAIIIVMGERKR